jgi:hypothetical protein
VSTYNIIPNCGIIHSLSREEHRDQKNISFDAQTKSKPNYSIYMEILVITTRKLSGATRSNKKRDWGRSASPYLDKGCNNPLGMPALGIR